jgi:hypothetical protein
MSATSALSSRVIIIWAGLAMDVAVAIINILYVFCCKIKNKFLFCQENRNIFQKISFSGLLLPLSLYMAASPMNTGLTLREGRFCPLP